MSLLKYISPLILLVTSVYVVSCAPALETVISEKSFTPNRLIPESPRGYGAGEDQLAQPDDVEILPNGNIVVTDVDNNRIQLFTAKGKLIKSVNATSLGMANTAITPTGIASDAQGNIYITLEDAGTIARFDSQLNLQQFIGYAGDVSAEEYYLPENNGLLMKPQGIAVSSSGDVFVIDMAKKVFKKDDVRNFGFRKFKLTQVDSGIAYVYDTTFAASQEVTAIMRKSEGMIISEAQSILFVAEEKPSKDQFGNSEKYRYVGLFDLTTGKFLDRLIGVDLDAGQITGGTTLESIEGLALFEDYLFTVAEKAGRVDCYDINTGTRISHFGTSAPYYCDDESDCIIDGVNYNEQSIMSGVAQVHLLNDWRKSELASPDGICITEMEDGSLQIGVVDQWNSRVLIYSIYEISELP